MKRSLTLTLIFGLLTVGLAATLFFTLWAAPGGVKPPTTNTGGETKPTTAGSPPALTPTAPNFARTPVSLLEVGEVTPHQDLQGWLTYRNSDIGLEISYPSVSWSIAARYGRGGRFSLAIALEPARHSSVEVLSGDVARSSWSAFLSGRFGTVPSPEPFSAEEYGCPGLLLPRARTTIDGGLDAFGRALFFDSKALLVLTREESEYSNFMDPSTVDAIVRSFRLHTCK